MVVVDHFPNLLGAAKTLSGLILGPAGIWDFSQVSVG